MLRLIKTLHTLIFLVMAGAVFWILYCGIVGLFDLPLYISLALISIEGIVFLGNGMVCPLTTLAEDYGAEKGYVFDSFFPEQWTRYTFPFFGTLLLIGVLLLGMRLLGIL